jgi:hypothetical protein
MEEGRAQRTYKQCDECGGMPSAGIHELLSLAYRDQRNVLEPRLSSLPWLSYKNPVMQTVCALRQESAVDDTQP